MVNLLKLLCLSGLLTKKVSAIRVTLGTHCYNLGMFTSVASYYTLKNVYYVMRTRKVMHVVKALMVAVSRLLSVPSEVLNSTGTGARVFIGLTSANKAGRFRAR